MGSNGSYYMSITSRFSSFLGLFQLQYDLQSGPDYLWRQMSANGEMFSYNVIIVMFILTI